MRLLLSVFLVILLNTQVSASLIATPQIERIENNTTSPFGQFREKSVQRFIFTKIAKHLVTEFDFKHVTYKDLFGYAPSKNMLYEASFRGYNLVGNKDFRVGRIWAGNDLLQPIDGASWHSPWGNKVSTTVQFGQIAKIDFDDKNGRPSFAEGRLQYQMNESAYFALQSCKNYDDDFASAIIGYSGDSLKVFSEYRSGNTTDTAHLALQYFDGKIIDITSDYYLNRNTTSDSGVARTYLGISLGKFYIETGIGITSYFNDINDEDSSFYEGSLTWEVTGKDQLSMGYCLETLPASSARTLSARAERNVSANTNFSLGVDTTSYDNNLSSIQNFESSLRRRVDWGYIELRGAIISGGDNSDLQKDISLKAGYDF